MSDIVKKKKIFQKALFPIRVDNYPQGTVKQITEYLQTAMAIDGDFLFPKLFFALLCIEYYEANDLRSPEDGEALLNGLSGSNVDSQELAFFKTAISTELI